MRHLCSKEKADAPTSKVVRQSSRVAQWGPDEFLGLFETCKEFAGVSCGSHAYKFYYPPRKPSLMLRAVIFDFDGLILDTETPEFRAWEAIYRQHGAVLRLEDWLPCIGTGSIFDPHAHMESLIGRKLEREEIAIARQVASHEMIMEQGPLPGVLKTLETAKRMGLRIGLASSSSRDWVEPHLDRLGIAGYFDNLQTSDCVSRVKPDAALYIQSLEALEVKPLEAIALEDSLNGLQSARDAGVFTVIIPNEMTRHMQLEDADLLLGSLEELDLMRIARQFNTSPS